MLNEMGVKDKTDKDRDDLVNESKGNESENTITDDVWVMAVYVGILAPVLCAIYQGYIWLKSGEWPGYTILDVFQCFNFMEVVPVVSIQEWAGLTKLVNWLIQSTLNMSIILGCFIFGCCVYGILILFTYFRATIDEKRENAYRHRKPSC